jgi:hypothetical protein
LRFCPTVNPGLRFSTTAMLNPPRRSCRVGALVRTTTRISDALAPPVMKVLAPLRR